MNAAVIISANFTTEPIEPSLSFWLNGLQLPFGVEFAPYDQIFQQLLDPGSLTSRNSRGINVFLIKLDRWGADSTGTGATAPLERNVDQFISALRESVARTPVPHLVVTCPPSPGGGGIEGAEAALAAAEERLRSGVAGDPTVHLVGWQEALRRYRVSDYYNAETDAIGQIPYTDPMFAALATTVARRVRMLKAAPYKVLVLDCDNTLWKGICGESGPGGVEIDASRKRLQDFVVRQYDAGMLICLCSKNNETDVAQVFEQRPDMPLKLDHVIASRVNWEPKSGNIRSLAEELNLGLDSFVFLDDSPYEVEEVRQHCPQVLALLAPLDDAGMERFIEHCWAFDRPFGTAEDHRRSTAYKENLLRDRVLRSATSLDDFLATIELKIDIDPLGPDDYPRAAQMTQRTNQFNTTTIRRSESELRQQVGTGSLMGRVVRVRDRFGDYGTVGLTLYQENGSTVKVEAMLLSCRALGRRVEHRMIADLGTIAGNRDVEVAFVPSSRNDPARQFLESLGMTAGEEGSSQTLTVPGQVARTAPQLNVGLLGEQPSEEPAPGPAAPPSSAPSALLARTYSDLWSPEDVAKAATRGGPRIRGDAAKPFIAPRNRTEEVIAAAWRRALRLDRVSVDDNYFDLGGTSLIAVGLFATLRKEFGRGANPTLLFEAPTVADLAKNLDQSGTASHGNGFTSLRPIRADGGKRPLFCIHGGAGSILFYYPLARALGPDQPVYAIQSQGLHDNARPHATIEAMATHYLSEIRSVQPQGPYQIAGFCLGAMIAFEMAQQLHRHGEQVAFLGSFDGRAPGFAARAGRAKPQRPGHAPDRPALPVAMRWLPKRIARGLVRRFDTVRRLPREDWIGYLFGERIDSLRRWFGKRRGVLLWSIQKKSGDGVPLIFRRTGWYFALNNGFAERRYRPATYPGRMTVFTIKGRFLEPELGWERWAQGGVTAIPISGEFRKHRDLMAQPMVERIAEELATRLDQPQPRPDSVTEPVEPMAIPGQNK